MLPPDIKGGCSEATFILEDNNRFCVPFHEKELLSETHMLSALPSRSVCRFRGGYLCYIILHGYSHVLMA